MLQKKNKSQILHLAYKHHQESAAALQQPKSEQPFPGPNLGTRHLSVINLNAEKPEHR